MAKHKFMSAFVCAEEFSRFATFISLLAKGRRGEIAAKLGVSKQTLYRLATDENAKVRAFTRRAIERVLAESAGIHLTASVETVEKSQPTAAPTKPLDAQEQTAAPADKLLEHLRDALLEAVSICGEPSKLAKALTELL